MNDIIQAPYTRGHSIFLEGPAGAGKTTLAVQRLRYLLQSGIPGDTILVLTPQRTLAQPYVQALHAPDAPGGSEVTVATIGGLARRAIDLFWPLLAAEAGFARPNERPIFLTLETAQYYMDRVLAPFLDKLYFEGVSIRRNRLASQILDNLNKAAAVGFSHTEIAARLSGAWGGESSRLRVYQQAQEVASAFRAHCLAEGLLDFSLQIELFTRQFLPRLEGQAFIYDRFQHVIADNIEEDVPVAHDLLREFLRTAASALMVYDQDAGYRAFLGADPASAQKLGGLCRRRIKLAESRAPSASLADLARQLSPRLIEPQKKPGDPRAALHYAPHRFHPQMLDWVADEVSRLVKGEGGAPGQIAILAPYLSDALRFALTTRLERFGVPMVSHRPSRALKEEAGARCLLTLAALAHPAWKIRPPRFDVAQMLTQAIAEMDWVRARQLSEIVYREKGEGLQLTGFAQIQPEMQQRITYLLGGRYDEMLNWLQGYAAEPPLELDHFLARLFAEVLSQPGFGFHHDLDAARAAANLIESIYKFRQALRLSESTSAGQEYLALAAQGVVAAQYIASWQEERADAVLIAPAYTFLMRNQAVDYQFWLEVGSAGWWERPYQPLTHPLVLSRQWAAGRVFSDEDEMESREEALQRLLLGLIRRCRRGVYLGISDLGAHGYEERGPLLHKLQQVLRETKPRRSSETSEVSRGAP
jgi:hypothetical protein